MGQYEKTIARFLSAILDFSINLSSIFVALLILREKWNVQIGMVAVSISIATAAISVILYFMLDIYSAKSSVSLHKILLKIVAAQGMISFVGFVCIAVFIARLK